MTETSIILGPPFHRRWQGTAGYSIKGYAGGRVPFCVGGRLHFVGDEHFLVVNAGQEYEFTTPADAPLFNFTIFMSELDVADAWASLRRSEESLLEDPVTNDQPLPEFLVSPMPVTEPVKEIRSQLRSATLAGSLSAASKAGAVSEIIDEALRLQWEAMGQIRRVRAIRPSTREESFRRIRRAIEFIESDYVRRHDLSLLAKVACMAKYHFLRRFKEVTGETPHQFILRRRLAWAEKLLMTTHMSAVEIGRRCGFADPTSFSSAFRAARGLPPQAWRSANSRAPALRPLQVTQRKRH
jgi:AraC family transcriptional regulator